jgi:DNA-directed RNA polymerase subunit M/transcription elongation factor TFIIS
MYLPLVVKDSEGREVVRSCNMCGYTEAEAKGVLVSELYIKERGSEADKIILNEFTRQDPTLPHLKTMKCPNETCETNTGGKERDVLYLKHDSENLKFLYICAVCNTHWRSRN